LKPSRMPIVLQMSSCISACRGARYSLRRDHLQRSFTVKVEADAGETDAERELLIIVVFDEIEEHIDLAISDNRVAAN
jgi:hypothetical protein